MTDISSSIACNLSEPDFREQKVMLRSTLSPFLVKVANVDGTSELTFSKPNVTREMLENFIALEGTCCPFFSFELSETSSHLQMNVTGPKGSEELVRKFFTVSSDEGCGCCSEDQSSPSKTSKFAFGFITMCAIGCAIPPTLGALGLIGVATGAYVGMLVEAVVIASILVGGGYLLLKYMKKRQPRGST